MRSTRSLSWIESLLGLDPVPAPPHVFAVGPSELRYGAFRSGPQGWACDAERRVALPPDLFQKGVLGGPLRDTKLFLQALEELLEGLGEPVTEASLVLPDTWLRLTFTELMELPRKASLRREVLAWKLKRLVPFRVEDLRVAASQVTPFPSQQEPVRMMIGFAVEALVSQLEQVFASAGVHLGQITNVTLSLIAAVEGAVAPDELAAVVAVHDDSYTLGLFHDGEPLIYRFKELADGGAWGGDSVARDLRMTSSFLRDHFPGLHLSRVFVVAPEDVQDAWLRWVGAELDAVPEALGPEHLEITRARPGTRWIDTAPLVGAVSLEVA